MNMRLMGRRRASGIVQLLASLLTGLWIGCASAQPVYLGTVFTDLWSVPAEPGWGLTVTHQEPVMFLTFYIYRADHTPYWVTATLVATPSAGDQYLYTGDLYENNGPPFAVAWDPRLVTQRYVGPVSLSSNDLLTATLTYVIDSVQVVKHVQRFALRNINFEETYVGAITYAEQDCVPPGTDGPTIVETGTLSVFKVGSVLRMILQGFRTTCSINGTYTQTGALGNLVGSLSCDDGTSGDGAVVLMQRSVAGMIAGFSFTNRRCSVNGTISGILPP